MRLIVVIITVLLSSTGFLLWGASQPRDALPLGAPQEQKLLWWSWVEQVPGHVRAYSEWLRNPRWVAWVVDGQALQTLGPRPEGFACSREWLWPVCDEAYRNSGYTRGHLAPNYAMGTLFGRPAQLASFSMRNISPQSRALNTRVWQRLEELEMDEIRRHSQSPLYVLTGPLFRRGPIRLKQGVAVPDAFWRVWLRRDDQAWRSLAFIVPQAVQGREDLRLFMVSVDEVERQAQLELFARLSAEEQHILESAVDWQAWGEASWWTQPPRY